MALWLLWTCLTVFYSNLQPQGLRAGLSVAYLIALVAVSAFVTPVRLRMRILAGMGALLSLVYAFTFPSNDRDWNPEVARTATATIDGDKVTIRDVRNFHFRGVEDYDERWETREYDLSRLETLDLFMSYWGPTAYCHTVVSFGFEGGEYLACSVEVRREVGEEFSTYGGFFKMFELSYIFADERDVILQRSNHRQEDVYLYRVRAHRERLRELFLSYVKYANVLAERPEFYDVIRNSCGVNILQRIADIGQEVWHGRDALLNGRWDRLMYERGAIHQGMPFEEVRARSFINARALAAGDVSGFSVRVREGLLPAPESPDS